MSHVRTSTHRGLLSAISVLIAQWLERLTEFLTVTGLIAPSGDQFVRRRRRINLEGAIQKNIILRARCNCGFIKQRKDYGSNAQ